MLAPIGATDTATITLPTSESQARELAPLRHEPDAMREAWEEAVEREKAGRPSPNLGEGTRHDRETDRKAAKATGYSSDTLGKVAEIRRLAGDEARPNFVRF